jgi:methanogenic corrinoid protein MtbC1
MGRRLKSALILDKLKIIFGGGQIDDATRRHTGADASKLNAMDAVKLF